MSWKILHTGFILSALVLDVLHCWCSCINSNPAKLINQHVKAARLIWRGHKRGLNKWCGRGQVRANVKTSQLFVAAAGVAAGQQVSAQLKISAQGRRPAPPAVAAQLKMFWWTLNVQHNHVLWLRRFFFSSFFGGTNKCLAGSLCAERLQNKFHSCRQNNLLRWWPGELWVKTGVVHSLGVVTRALLHTTGRYESKALDSECRLHFVSFT